VQEGTWSAREEMMIEQLKRLIDDDPKYLFETQDPKVLAQLMLDYMEVNIKGPILSDITVENITKAVENTCCTDNYISDSWKACKNLNELALLQRIKKFLSPYLLHLSHVVSAQNCLLR